MARNRHPRPSRDAPPSVGRAILGLAAALSLATCVRDTTGPSVTATKLDFLVPPGTLVAGHQFSPAVKVRAEDAGGNKAAGFAGAVTIELKRNPAGATLSGTTTVTAVNGVATFFDLSLDKADTGYTFQATSDGLLAIASATFDVVPGPPRQLAFTVEPPDSAAAGAAFAPAVQVSALDAAGNLVPTFADSVTVALGNNPGGGTLGGTTAVAAVNGVATFTTLTLDKTAPGYWLIATATGLSKATSSAFDVIAGTATQLVFGIEPGTTIAGHQISPAVKVRALDALGNLVPGFTSNVSIALASNPGGATLSGTTPVPAASGVATFFDLSLDRTGTGYTLTASASGLAPATSSAFDITPGAARQLAFTVQPVTSTAAVALAPAVQVSVLDASGNLVPAFTGNVGVTLGNNPGGSTLGGTTTVAAVKGVATFGTLTLDKASNGYWLTATAAGLSTATSSSFNITPAAATQLAFDIQPGTTIAGHQISPAVKIRALDAFGNVATGFTGALSVALGANPGGATLAGTTPVVAVSGVATFFDLSVNKTGTGYTLTASATGFAPVTSTAFDITSGTPTQLVFTVQPSNAVAGAPIAPAVQVSALDAAGNLVPAFAGTVTVALGNNPGGSALGGATTVATSGGVATFSTLTLDKTSNGYWLTATATGLSTATSASFNVTAGTATRLAFGTEPGTTIAGHQISPAVKVRALDALGNLVPTFTGNVSIALGNNPGGGALSGTTPVAAVSGVATFFDLSINKSGSGYTLTASASGFAPVPSTAFDVTPGTATQLAFTVQPSNTMAGAVITPAVQVSALDGAGNLVPSFTGNMTVALGNNPGGSTLGGTTTVAAVGGVATFSTLTLDKTAPGYWLSGTATGLSTATSGS
ncbi:MAG: hemagglutinin, partial [Gemmatimonadetes bacterium]